MKYSNLSYKLTNGEDIEVIGEYYIKANLYCLSQDYYGNYRVFLLNSDEDLEEIEDIDLIQEIVDLWQEENYNFSLKYWEDDNDINSELPTISESIEEEYMEV